MARVYLSTPTRKQKANDQWWESYALKCGCVGANPMEFRTYFKDWVCGCIVTSLGQIKETNGFMSSDR